MMMPIIIFVVLIVGILYPNVFTLIGSVFPDGSFSLQQTTTIGREHALFLNLRRRAQP